MKIQELFEAKNLLEPLEAYLKRLKNKHKLKELGHGAYATVFTHPVYSNVAVKVQEHGESLNYLEYVRQCKSRNNRWLPKFISVHRVKLAHWAEPDNPHVSDNYDIIFMKKYSKSRPSDILAAKKYFLSTLQSLSKPQYKKIDEELRTNKPNRGGNEIQGFGVDEFYLSPSNWLLISKASSDPEVRELALLMHKCGADDNNSANLLVDHETSEGFRLIFADPC